MKIAIIADSHDCVATLTKAVQQGIDSGVEHIFFAWDLGRPSKCVPALAANHTFPVDMVLGNNDAEVYGILDHGSPFSHFHLRKNGQYGNGYECIVDGIRIFMHHYPKIAELAAKSGEFDLCIHGHTHRYREEWFGTALVCNPGAIIWDTEPASFVIYDTKTKSVAKILL